jgi:hypothetical protein
MFLFLFCCCGKASDDAIADLGRVARLPTGPSHDHHFILPGHHVSHGDTFTTVAQTVQCRSPSSKRLGPLGAVTVIGSSSGLIAREPLEVTTPRDRVSYVPNTQSPVRLYRRRRPVVRNNNKLSSSFTRSVLRLDSKHRKSHVVAI